MSRSHLPSLVPADEQAQILVHEAVAPDHFLLRLHAPRIAGSAQPGMFLQIRVADGTDPFLRRPMSIGMTRPESGEVDVIYRAGGAGTKKLTRRVAGESLSVLGPLGHPFRLPGNPSSPDGTKLILVGGGVGMPPMHFVASRVHPSRVHVIQGARTESLLLFREELTHLGVKTTWTTEDGTAGERGLVTKALAAALDAGSDGVEILSCGPTAMMKAVAGIAFRHDISCQVSLEERMACGFGICMGCAVKLTDSGETPEEYGLVCVDGPVFDARDVFGP